jgi:hypothetical protein
MTLRTCQITRHPLLVWLVRGGIGIALLVFAASTREMLVVVPAILAALFAFGGCPMCWTLGLVQRSYRMFRPVEGDRTP